MMDLKEIIKWFIPCFHILVFINRKSMRLTFVCLFLLFILHMGCAANVRSIGVISTKNVGLINDNNLEINQSDVLAHTQSRDFIGDVAVGRTFGRPFKKMMGALLPLVFQIGAASTWAVVAALVGVKTLAVTLVILKILLIAGAAKVLALAESQIVPAKRVPKPYILYRVINNRPNATNTKWVQFDKVGALFGSKGHQQQGWEPPHHQKEIHLHIHNGHHEEHVEHAPVYGSWSREDGTTALESKIPAVGPYSVVGPQTIRTPFGNYVKVESNELLSNPT